MYNTTQRMEPYAVLISGSKSPSISCYVRGMENNRKTGGRKCVKTIQ
jgi:hypothetical protein